MVRRHARLLALVLFAALALPFVEYRTDDTFIFLRYAANLAHGAGLSFNPGEPVYGFTSILWVLILTVPAALGVHALFAAKAIALAAGGAAILAFGVLARRRLPIALAGPAAVALAANAWLVRWSAAAMETSLAVALLLAGLARHAAEVEDDGKRPLAAVILAVAVLARPEAGLLLAVGLACEFICGGARARWRAVAGGVLAALLLAPWFAYAHRTFGTIVPETAEAKGRLALAGLDLDPLRDVVRAVATTSGLEALLLVAGLIALALRGPSRRVRSQPDRPPARLAVRRHGPALLWLLGLPLLYLATGFDVLSRYALPVIPVVVLYGFMALGLLVRGERALARAASLLAVLVVLQNAFVLARVVYPHTHTFSGDVEDCLGGLGRWCRDNTPPGTAIAIADIGAFGYYSERRVIDLAGLVTPELLPLVNAHPIEDIAAGLLFADIVRPAYLVDRHPEPERLGGAFGGALELVQWCRIEGLGVRSPAPIAYTLYRLDWARYDAYGTARKAAGDQ
jgi:hypothetical protein